MAPLLTILGSSLLPGFGCVAIFAAAAAAGTWIYRRVHRESPTNAVDGFIAIAIGLGLLGHATLALGLVRMLNRWSLIALLAVFVLLGRRGFGPVVRSLGNTIQSASRNGLATRIFAAILLLHAAAYVVVGLAPITGADAIKFYLTFPKRYVEAGRVFHIGPHAHSGTPQTGSMLYAAAMATVNERAAALMPSAFLGLTVLLIVAVGARLGRSRLGWAAATLFACCPGVSVALGMDHGVDSILVLFATAAFAALFEYLQTARRSNLVVSATLGGLAASTKLNGLFLAPTCGICLLVFIFCRCRDVSNAQSCTD